MGKLVEYLDHEAIFFLEMESRDEVLEFLVDDAVKRKKVPDREVFYQALLSRERLVSTGVGMGAAFPHAKDSSVERFFISLAVLKKGIDWDAFDGAPVRLVFMIGGPDDKQTEYLQILSAVTEAIKDEEFRKKIVTAQSVDAIIALLEEDKT